MSLLGIWIFVGLLYQGQELPPPNPALQIVYHFSSNTENTLRYWREGEQGFCERRAQYSLSQDQLYQKVVEVHPDNAPWCSQDSDMRLGFESWTVLREMNGRLYLKVLMGEEDLSFIWERRAE
ncbi:hypothetical protein [Bdellovibrio bacteriovorus]|uniref:Uncharacterized protein n=1 Tax=Bdellovibrio bacteriovorus TaxID=959 RepID=A0A1Z3NAH9_BDEBC|nr:hypothetical protein [Bdellovibrio bacteriovorus]ASD64459.1 hypothetical protein B9G79_13215 [Bdellovibrio bacteriovorus]